MAWLYVDRSKVWHHSRAFDPLILRLREGGEPWGIVSVFDCGMVDLWLSRQTLPRVQGWMPDDSADHWIVMEGGVKCEGCLANPI